MKDKSAYILQSLLERHFKDVKIKNGEAMMECRFCRNNSYKNKLHLYIKLGNENEVPLYHCFKCERKGILTPNILIKLIPEQDITPRDILDIQYISWCYILFRY